MQLSKNFSLDELCVTNSGLANRPNQEQINALTDLCIHVLQPLRDLYGKHITVNSGFRSAKVNQEANKGKIKPSQHMKGHAADLDNGRSENIILYNLILKHFEFDQLINESDFAWIHVSYKKTGNRKMLLKL